MLEKVRCIDANAKQLTAISNEMLRKSRKFAEQACIRGGLNSRYPKFNQERMKKFYSIQDFYEKNGEIKQIAKPVFAQILKDFGLRQNATLGEFAEYVLNVYK